MNQFFTDYNELTTMLALHGWVTFAIIVSIIIAVILACIAGMFLEAYAPKYAGITALISLPFFVLFVWAVHFKVVTPNKETLMGDFISKYVDVIPQGDSPEFKQLYRLIIKYEYDNLHIKDD